MNNHNEVHHRLASKAPRLMVIAYAPHVRTRQVWHGDVIYSLIEPIHIHHEDNTQGSTVYSNGMG